MKTIKAKIEASAPANVRPSNSVSKTSKVEKPAEVKQWEFVKHYENRCLDTDVQQKVQQKE